MPFPSVLRFAACSIALALAGGAQAQDFPNKPIRIVVPYAPGGAPDVTARAIALRMSETIGQQVIVENKPGAGGGIATHLVMRASPADGYNMLIADSAVYAIAPRMYRDFPVDTKEWQPVSLAGEAPIFLVANSGAGIGSVKELVAQAKAKPGLPYGSSGNGSPHHLAMELVRALSGAQFTHVPYKGTGQSVPAIVAGEVAVGFSALSSAMPHAKAGKLKILAVASGRRTRLYPEMPTLAEAGVPGFEVNINLGLFVPQKTPRAVVDKLNREVAEAVKTPEVQKRLTGLGIDPVGSSVEQFSEIMQAEISQYGKLLQLTGARVE